MLLKIGLHDYYGTHMDINIANITEPVDMGFHNGVAASLCVTVMSELGDKSFFMSAILAMHNSQTLTFLGSVLGHLIMTVVAVVLGVAASLIPVVYVKWFSFICMTYFGIKMLKEGFSMEEEMDNNQLLNINISIQSQEISTSSEDVQEKPNCKPLLQNSTSNLSSKEVLAQAFTLSFLGEWGDRSQIATILLASTENPYGVAVGSMLGHVICSLTAVVIGHQLGQKFPVKTMTQAGGVVFLLCAASSLLFE